MLNLVIASDTLLCQKAKRWLIKNKGFIDAYDQTAGQPSATAFSEPYRIHMIMDDAQLLDGSGDIPFANMYHLSFPGDYVFAIIMCSTTNNAVEKKHMLHAISFTYLVKKRVQLAKSIVYKAWNDDMGEKLVTDFYEVSRNTDPESSLKDLQMYSY